MPRDPGLNGRPRQRLLAQVRAEEERCHLCGHPVDLTLDRQRHPLGSTVDELTPRSQGGDPLDRANCRHAHRTCNELRGTRPVTPDVQAECRRAVDALLGAVHTRVW